MKEPEKKPFQKVTLEEMCAFYPDRPETFTASPLINAMLDSMISGRCVTIQEIAYRLELPEKALPHAFEALTGMKFRAFREEWHKAMVERLQKAHPYWNTEEIARELGLADRSALWRLYHRENERKYKRRMRKNY